MVFFNYSTMQMVIKVVYYGPGLCGKTTNLEFIYSKTAPNSRGEMVSLETETDRTLFFDLLPIDVGVIGGFRTRFQLYTVPGQVFYNSTRKLVLKGVDGIIFVADSQTPMLDANLDSFKNMVDNLNELGLDHRNVPIVMQYNKRDLKNILSVDEMNAKLNPDGFPYIEACALDGTGVFETLKQASKHTLMAVKQKMVAEREAVKAKKPVVPAEPPVQTAPVEPEAEAEQLKAVAAPATVEAPEAVPEPEEAAETAPAAEVEDQKSDEPEVEPATGVEPDEEEMEAAEPLTGEREPSMAEATPSDLESQASVEEPEAPMSSESTDAPQLTMDDIHEPEPEPEPASRRRKIKTDMDVDELLSGLVPSKQTFIKKLAYDFDRNTFKKIQEAHLVVEFRDENGNTVDTREFTTHMSKKSGTRKVQLKLNIDMES